MLPRALHQFEVPIAEAVVDFGTAVGWEFAAFLKAPQGPLIEMRSQAQPDGADPSGDVKLLAAAGVPVVVHHNHLSQESLSGPDWFGLCELFSETFAHCADGTVYWGQAIDHPSIRASTTGSNDVPAMNALFSILDAAGVSDAADLSGFFRKEVLNRAMLVRGFVKYGYSWGNQPVNPRPGPGSPQTGPAGITGASIDHLIDRAAAQLAPSL